MHKLCKKVALATQNYFLGFDQKLILKGTGGSVPNGLQPIFILGAPRSGSTIFYQYFSKYFQVSYLSNAMAAIPSHMGLMLRLQRMLGRAERRKDVPKNTLGFVPGVFAPNEGGGLFRFWFDSVLTEDHMKNVQSTIWNLSEMSGSPFVSKNLNNSLRIEKILSCFPEAKFIVIERTLEYNAQDLLNCRRKVLGNVEQWFSVQPSNSRKWNNYSPHEQVVLQVIDILSGLDEGLKSCQSRVAKVGYEDFCMNPEKTLNEIGAKLHLNKSVEYNQVDFSSLVLDQKKIDQNDWNALVEAVRKYA